jgi:hypothetical protein
MSYSPNHTEDECDKCLKKVGKKNLNKVPFLYLDKNDHTHPDVSPKIREAKRKELEMQGLDAVFIETYMEKFHVEDGYRQYYVCDECFEFENKRTQK